MEKIAKYLTSIILHGYDDGIEFKFLFLIIFLILNRFEFTSSEGDAN